MKCCLLASSKTAAMHLLYHAQTRGVKFSDVILVDTEFEADEIFQSYKRKNGFNLYIVPDANSEESANVLRGISPDILAIKMGGTILNELIIEIPNIATVNAHPGILPEYRGVHTVHWALLNGDDVGVTAHLVDAGVDTGDTLIRRELAVDPNETVDEVIEKNYYQNHHQAMVDAVRQIQQGQFESEPQDQTDGKQYFSMHPKLKEIVDEKHNGASPTD